MSLIPNRLALRHLTLFSFDAGCCQQYAAKVFNRSASQTEISPEDYKKLCLELSQIIADASENLNALDHCVASILHEGEG